MNHARPCYPELAENEPRPAVGVYNLLGKTVRNQTAGIALGLAGQDAAAKTATGTNAKKAAVDASADANNAKSLESFADATGKK